MTKGRIHSLRTLSGLPMLAAALLSGCQQREMQQPADAQDPVDEAGVNRPSISRPAALDRAGLLAAVAQAASAAASGSDVTAAQRALDGRQFELRIRFGCRGPSTKLSKEWLGWAFDAAAGTLRVRAKPTLAADDPLVREVGGDSFEAVEGFWIPRPWLLEPACPATSTMRSAPVEEANKPAAEAPSTGKSQAAAETTGDSEPVRAGPRIGIAQFFTDTDARTRRRSGRAYEAVKTLDSAQPVGSQGFDLVLSGRLKALPGGRVIACVAKSADSPPECVVSADFDRAWIAKPGTGDVIADWGGG